MGDAQHIMYRESGMLKEKPQDKNITGMLYNRA